MSHSLASGAAAAGAPLQTSSRLGLRGRIAGLAIGLILLGAVCGVVALSGLLTEKGKVASVSTTFRDFRTERSAYEGWLTSDDQMNMYAALGVLPVVEDRAARPLALLVELRGDLVAVGPAVGRGIAGVLQRGGERRPV